MKYYKGQDIAMVKETPQGAERNYSEIAEKWLCWMEKQEQVPIQRQLAHGGEKKIGCEGRTYFVDGYAVMPDGKRVAYEFNGCYWHGMHTFKFINSFAEKMRQRRDRTEQRQYHLEHSKMLDHVVVKWECEFVNDMRANKELRDFCAKLDNPGRLHPRRTEAFKAFSTPGKTVHYQDVNSMYPHVQREGRYPVGDARIEMFQGKADQMPAHIIRQNANRPVTVYNEGLQDVENRNVQEVRIWGFLYVDVVVPRDIPIALLPLSVKGGLQFPVCGRCAQEKKPARTCSHSDAERYLRDVYWSEELQLALDWGCKVVRVHETMSWSQSTDDFFKDYVTDNIKRKVEASGWPAADMSEDEKQQFLDNFKEEDGGACLDREILDRGMNPAGRWLAKLANNNLWGKFGQKTNQSTTTICYTAEQVERIWCDPSRIITGEHLMADENVWIVSHKGHREDIVARSRGSVAVAAITTSRARIRLNSLLLQIYPNQVYCDTDSIVFEGGPVEEDELVRRFYVREVGPQLGQLSSEIPSGWTCQSFVCPGSKQYAALLKKDGADEFKQIIKIRGITQDLNNKGKLDKDILLNMVNRFIKMNLENAAPDDDDVPCEFGRCWGVKGYSMPVACTDLESFLAIAAEAVMNNADDFGPMFVFILTILILLFKL
ncbi:unnamed protein product, partial [Mesorhabditis spiculigera]